MENPSLSDFERKQHCEAPNNLRLKFDLDKSLFPNEAQKLIQENKKVGESFFKQGELRLLHGDSSGIQFFDLALQLDPNNFKLYYEQGLALLEFSTQKGNEKTLLLAAKRFKSAVKLLPSFFEGWHAYGNALFSLAKITKEYHYLLEAESKYKQALAISRGQPSDILADLYWNYGATWRLIAQKSKEPSDMINSIQGFEKALKHQEDLPKEFWYEYGHSSLDVGSHLNDVRYFNQGIHCFKNAVSLSISSFESWFHLGKALASLYNFSHDEDHFTQANECFVTAAQLNSKSFSLWLEWASLLKNSGKLIKDVKRLHSAIEKCQKALRIEDNHELVVAIWVEAQSAVGLLTDKVSLIHEAQNKIYDLMEKAPNPELLHAFGYSLYCLGCYFNDLDYFYQAVEKFQEGLSLDRTLHKLWHALGYSYTKAALIDDDEGANFEKAHRFYQKALTLQSCSLYHFDYGYSLFKYAETIDQQEVYKRAAEQFEGALNLQKDSIYLHPEWLFYYGISLDHLAGFHDDQNLYVQALELLNQVLVVDPEHPKIHYNLALVYTHYAEISGEPLIYQKALYHYKLAYKKEEENDQILLDYAITLASYGDFLEDNNNKNFYFRESEFKMMQAAKLGNIHAFYHLACLYSLLGDYSKSIYFLKKAEAFEALPTTDELLEDDWLEKVRKTEYFEEFLSYLDSKSSAEE